MRKQDTQSKSGERSARISKCAQSLTSGVDTSRQDGDVSAPVLQIKAGTPTEGKLPPVTVEVNRYGRNGITSPLAVHGEDTEKDAAGSLRINALTIRRPPVREGILGKDEEEDENRRVPDATRYPQGKMTQVKSRPLQPRQSRSRTTDRGRRAEFDGRPISSTQCTCYSFPTYVSPSLAVVSNSGTSKIAQFSASKWAYSFLRQKHRQSEK